MINKRYPNEDDVKAIAESVGYPYDWYGICVQGRWNGTGDVSVRRLGRFTDSKTARIVMGKYILVSYFRDDEDVIAFVDKATADKFALKYGGVKDLDESFGFSEGMTGVSLGRLVLNKLDFS